MCTSWDGISISHHQQQAPNERTFLFFHHFHTQSSRKYAIYTDWDLRVGINFFLLKRSKIIIDFGAKNLWWKFVVRKRRKWREKKKCPCILLLFVVVDIFSKKVFCAAFKRFKSGFYSSSSSHSSSFHSIFLVQAFTVSLFTSYAN